MFDLDPETGAVSARRRFLDFSDEQVWPDGMTVDDDGSALGRAGDEQDEVHRYRPDGALDGVVEVPTSNPTSVAFGGADGGDLYITTSWSRPATSTVAQPAPGRRDLPLPPRRHRTPSPRLADLPPRRRPTSTHHDLRKATPMIERMVILGASGDLTSRLLMPAVAQLAEADLLPPGFTIVGAANAEWSTEDFRQHIATELEKHATVPAATRDAVVRRLSFQPC